MGGVSYSHILGAFLKTTTQKTKDMRLKAILTMIILTGLMATQYAYGQKGWIDSLKIIPTTPRANDEIKLVCYTTFPSGYCFLNSHTFNIQGNEITVMLNFSVGAYAYVCYSVDTLTIGTLNAANYKLTANLTIDTLQAIFDTKIIEFIVDNSLGLNHTPVKNGFEIYPNPFGDELTIKVTNGADLHSIEIYSLIGNKVFQEEIKTNSSINVSHLTNGLYVVILTDRKGQQYKKKIVKNTIE